MNCDHGWEDKDGEPAPCYECLAQEADRRDREVSRLLVAIRVAREIMREQRGRLQRANRTAVEAWRQRDESRRVLRTAADDMERLRDYVSFKAMCPCCERDRECMDECTFATDAPADYEEMQAARAALWGQP